MNAPGVAVDPPSFGAGVGAAGAGAGVGAGLSPTRRLISISWGSLDDFNPDLLENGAILYVVHTFVRRVVADQASITAVLARVSPF